jgi:hypothetical protein
VLQIALTTLEEVFLNIAKQAEIEAAGDSATVQVEVEDGVRLDVPLGEDHVSDPRTGVQYRIHWAQDENGALAVSHADRVEAAA